MSSTKSALHSKKYVFSFSQGKAHPLLFFTGVGVDCVSCSPFRVPIAQLAASQAQIRFPRKGN